MFSLKPFPEPKENFLSSSAHLSRFLLHAAASSKVTILQMDCWRALTELDAKAQETQELRNQLK